MNIRRTLLVAGIALMTTGLMAQNSAVTNASMSLKDAKGYLADENLEKAAKGLSEAAGYIESAITHEKTMNNEKTWRYRGDIYQLIARNLDNPAFAAIDADAVKKAGESYSKALTLDTKGSYEQENKQGLAIMQNLAVNSGINFFNESKFPEAFQMFEQGSMLAEKMGVTDTLAVFNAALAADRSEDNDNAIKYYTKAIELDYDEPNMFIFLKCPSA